MSRNVICKYNFTKDLNNTAPPPQINCEVIRGSIESDSTGSYYHGNLVAHKGSDININQPFFIRFEYRYISGLTDWGYFFAFGTHDSYGGDNTNFEISIRNQISSSDHNWYRFTLTRSKDDNGIYLLQEKLNQDNKYIIFKPKYKYTTSPTSITGFYFNGAGRHGQLTGDIRKFIFILGTDVYEKKLITYSNLKIE